MNVVFYHLAQTVGLLQEIFFIVLFTRIIGSFFPPTTNGIWSRISQMAYNLTEPILGPIRNRIPMMGALDFSPLIAFFLVDIVSYILIQVLQHL